MKTESMKVLLLQFNSVWHDTQANLTRLQALLDQQPNLDEVDLVVLPETFHAGFSMQPECFAESVDGDISQALAALAQRYQFYVVAGVAQKQIHSKCDGQQETFFNRALAFDRQGRQIGSYSKQKLFSYAGEDHAFAAGHTAQIIELDGQRVALFICYDLRFPELFRSVAKQVQGMIVIANWPASRQLHWETLLQARAIENQCVVIGVNRTGEDGNGLRYVGGSSAFNPLGERLVYAQENQLDAVFDVAWSQTDQVREEFRFLDDLNTP